MQHIISVVNLIESKAGSENAAYYFKESNSIYIYTQIKSIYVIKFNEFIKSYYLNRFYLLD
jgi:hypothetical protein